MDSQTKELIEKLKPLGQMLFDIQAKRGISSLDVWVTSEPGVIIAQYFDKNYNMQIERIDCNEKEETELEGLE